MLMKETQLNSTANFLATLGGGVRSNDTQGTSREVVYLI